MLGTAEATDNAIHAKGARVVAKRKRARSSRQPSWRLPPPAERPRFELGRTRAAMPLIARQLEIYRHRYDRGDHAALLRALDLWLSCYQGPPAWIADAFFKAWLKWLRYEAPTLDAAFGVQRPVGKQFNKQREREDLRPFIVLEVEARRQQGMPLDVRLFELVGAEINKSAGYVSKMYYDKASSGWRLIAQSMSVTRLSAAE